MTAKEQRILPIPQNCGSASVVVGMVAHELAAREQEITQMDCYKGQILCEDADKFSSQKLKPIVSYMCVCNFKS